VKNTISKCGASDANRLGPTAFKIMGGKMFSKGFIYRWGTRIIDFGERVSNVKISDEFVFSRLADPIINLGKRKQILCWVVQLSRRFNLKGSKVVYQLFVNGIPRAQPRPRKGKYGNFYSNSPSVRTWKNEIIAAFLPYRHHQPINEAIHLRVDFFMPIPKSIKIKEGQIIPHTKKPDADNLLKAVQDAMSQAGVWEDDSLVFWPEAPKWYALGKMGAQITVETGF
jgi:Holliday junction resolvase RusA-like endonuclease